MKSLAVFCAFLTTLAANANAVEYLVVGQGAPRAEYELCNREIPLLNAALKASGLAPIERIYCISPLQDPNSFVPVFRAKGARDLIPETVFGARFNSLSYCHVERQRISDALARINPVLESSCRKVAAPDEMFQPAIVVLTRALRPDPSREYDAADVLIRSADEARLRALN